MPDTVGSARHSVKTKQNLCSHEAYALVVRDRKKTSQMYSVSNNEKCSREKMGKIRGMVRKHGEGLLLYGSEDKHLG